MNDDQSAGLEALEALAWNAAPIMACTRGHSRKCDRCKGDLMDGAVLPSEISPPPEAMASLLARLEDFRYHLDYFERNADHYNGPPGDIAAAMACRELLAFVEAWGQYYAIANAVDEFERWTKYLREIEAGNRSRREAEYAETERRFKVAIEVACPFCGSEPGATCRSAGPNGKGQSKGQDVHADRYRAGCHLLDEASKEGSA